MQEASWEDFDDDVDEACDICHGKFSCRCDDDYEVWKDQMMEIDDDQD
jgi:hypothetical protein